MRKFVVDVGACGIDRRVRRAHPISQRFDVGQFFKDDLPRSGPKGFQTGKVERVFADETRPVGQGARLTSWELSRAGVPVTVICDNMAASLMSKGMIDLVVVGADRIAANGDVANKIGTYGVAVLARHHGIPFYVAAPASTFDVSLPDGSAIPIEERDPSEVLPQPIDGVDVYNPAFDVTPAELISGIITEFGVFPPQDAAREVAARVG